MYAEVATHTMNAMFWGVVSGLLSVSSLAVEEQNLLA